MNSLRTTLLMAALTGLFLLIGGMLGGQSGMTMALVIAFVMNFGDCLCDELGCLLVFGQIGTLHVGGPRTCPQRRS